MSNNIAARRPPHGLSLRRIGTGCTVRQLDQRHHREGHIFTACTSGDFAQYLPCIAALALCRNEHAGVEY
jgi:hypothetical protein